MENIFKDPPLHSNAQPKSDFDIFASATSTNQDQFDSFNITTEKRQENNDWLGNQEQEPEGEQFSMFNQPLFSRNVHEKEQEQDNIEQYYIKNRKSKASEQIQKFNKKMESGGIDYQEESRRLKNNENLNENRNLLNEAQRAFKTLPKQFSIPYIGLEILLLIHFFYVRAAQTYVSSAFVVCAIMKIIFSGLHYCPSGIKHSTFLLIQGIIIVANILTCVACSAQELGLVFLLVFIGADTIYLSKLKSLYEISTKIEEESPSIQLMEDNQF